MRAVRIPLFVLLAVLFFILWNAAWVTDRCGEWTAAVDTVTADLDAGGDGGAALAPWTTCGRTFKAICTSSSPMRTWTRPRP